MSFVPVTGPATFRPADPPRDGTIEFTAERRSVTLPIRAALPVLSRARTEPDVHPSVALLGGAALLAGRFVAAGKLAPAVADGRPSWRIDGLDERDRDSVTQLARARAYDDLDPVAATALVDARARCRRRCAAAGGAGGDHATPRPVGLDTSSTSEEPCRLRRAGTPPGGGACRAERADGAMLPELVRISLRVEADEEELVARLGARRAPGPRRARPAPRPGRRAALVGRRVPRLRTAGPSAREHRAPGGRGGVAGARPAAGPVGARPAHPRRRRDRQPARARRRRSATHGSTCTGHGHSVAT